MTDEPILTVDDLSVEFATEDGRVPAVRGLSFALSPGKTLGVVGESGAGKSVMCLALMGLLPPRTARVSGSVRIGDRAVVGEGIAYDDRVRGRDVAMIFQDPMTSLNPFLKIGLQLSEVLEVHEGMSRRNARKRAVEVLIRVGIADADRRMDHFPHQFSGGMRQRVMIAMALLTRPKVLIADEATTALDVTIQAQIVDLMRGLSSDFGTAIVFVTHDMGVIASIADDVLVMYAGRAVEHTSAVPLFANAQHPYTRGLLSSVPRINSSTPLTPIPGRAPTGNAIPDGCAFHPRCAFVVDGCRQAVPALQPAPGGGWVACPVPGARRGHV